MGAISKLFACVVAVLLIAAGLWFAQSREAADVQLAEAAAPKTPHVAEEQLQPLAPIVPERESLAPAVRDADPAALTQKPAAPAANEPAAPAESSSRLRARFVDSAGQPWSDVLFTRVDRGEPSTRSAADGRAELTIPLGKDKDRRDQVEQFTATRTGCATRTMRATLTSGGVVDLGEVVLEREARVRGIVHDASGTALEDVTVGVAPAKLEEVDPGHLRRNGSMHFDRLLVAKSDAHGIYELQSLPAGAWRVWGQRAAGGYGVSEPFELQAGEQKDGVDFEVPALLATDSISGKVIDPNGQPVPEAQLTLNVELDNSSWSTGNQAKADGTFVFIVPIEAPADLTAAEKDHRWTDALLRGVQPGARDVVLQLGDPKAQPHARLRVHGPADEPVRKIQLEGRTGKPNSYSSNTLGARETEPGLFDFEVPLAAFGLTVAAEGYLDSKLLPLDPASPPEELEVALELAPVLRGRVTAAGKPVAAATVEARREVKRDLTFNGFPCIMNTNAEATGKSGADGAFLLHLQGNEPFYLRCSAPGHAPTIVGPLRGDALAEVIEIPLGAGGALEGRARAKDGAPVVGAIVGITNGDAHPRTMRSGHDGVFRFEGLAEGKWLVLERDEEFRTDWTSTRSTDDPQHIEWSCDVAAGRTTYHDLVVAGH